MGGGSVYGLPTKSELNRASFGGAKPTNTQVLTADNIQWALDVSADRNPNFKNLTTTAALNAVEDVLEDIGFKNVDTSHSTITGPGGAKFLIKRGNTRSGFIVRDKKKRK